MEQQERQQIQAVVHKMLGAMVQLKGSDLFLTAGFPPAIKLNGKLTKLNETVRDFARHYAVSILPARPYSPKDKAAAESAVESAAQAVEPSAERAG